METVSNYEIFSSNRLGFLIMVVSSIMSIFSILPYDFEVFFAS